MRHYNVPKAFTSIVACLLVSATFSAQAQQSPQASQADLRLSTFTPQELGLLEPLLGHGIVSLVEFASDDTLPAIVIACDVVAPPSVVAAVLGQPEAYPNFMSGLDSVTITHQGHAIVSRQSRVQQLSYDWIWNAAVFTLRGQNVMQEFSSPPHPERGYRFVFRSTGGDLGVGRTVWRILPRGVDANGRPHSLVMSSSRMDFRDANYIARQLASGGAAVNRTINIAMAFSVFIRTRAEAERRVGVTHVPASQEVVRPPLDPVVYENMLMRGDLMWVDTSDGTDLGNMMVLGRMHYAPEQIRAMILDPGGFTQGLLQGASATTTFQDEHGSEFDWGINLPLIGTTGHMRMREEADGLIHLDSTAGAMQGATWRFETTARDYGGLVMTWGYFDLNSLWLVRLVTDSDIAFRPGISIAAQLMMVRGLRGRLILANQ